MNRISSVADHAYDDLGRLTTVTDALTHETSYTYDERGRKLTETDAELHTTAWAYDFMGRQVSRTLPLGQEESFARFRLRYTITFAERFDR